MKRLLIIFLILITTYVSNGQGCADAGLCTIDMNHKDTKSSLNYNYSIGLGLGEQYTLINSYKMSLFYSPIDNVTIFAGLPFNLISGDITNTNGVGDIDFGIQYSLKIDDKNELKYSMSLKSSLDREPKYMVFKSGIAEALPMVYHPSLGNDNLIFVLEYYHSKWEFTGGFLLPLSQPNKNEFVSNRDLTFKTKPLIFDEYLTSASLERGSDVMLRVRREVYKNESINVIAGINPLYRIGNNKVTFEDYGEVKTIEIEDSGGFTLNLLGEINYTLSQNNILSFTLGFPVVARLNQNDGLLRLFQSRLSISGNIF